MTFHFHNFLPENGLNAAFTGLGLSNSQRRQAFRLSAGHDFGPGWFLF